MIEVSYRHAHGEINMTSHFDADGRRTHVTVERADQQVVFHDSALATLDPAVATREGDLLRLPGGVTYRLVAHDSLRAITFGERINDTGARYAGMTDEELTALEEDRKG